MSYPSPSRWTDQLWRSAVTLLGAALLVYFAFKLFSIVWPLLAIAAGILLVIRIALSAATNLRDKSDW